MRELLLGEKSRVSSILILMIAVIMLLAACSSKEFSYSEADTGTANDNDDSSDVKKSSEPVTISFWFPWGGGFQKEFYDTVVKPFEAVNPDIKVQMTFVENSDNTQASGKLQTAIAGGQAPDVAMFDRFMVGQWAEMDSLEDLTWYAIHDDMASLYYPNVWSETQYKGRTYALPWNMDSRAMFYNKSMMQEAGLDPDKPPTTIAELDAMAERMFKKNSNGSYDQVGIIPWMAQGFLYTHGWNFGGQWEKNGELMPNDPQIVKALEWIQSYARKYDNKKMTNFSNSLRQRGQNPFMSGKVGFIFEGNWLLNDIDKANFEWGVAPMPSEEGNKSVTWAGGWSFVMPKGATNQDQAWRFIKFIAGKEGALLWAGRPASNYDLTCIPEVNAQLGLDKKEKMNIFIELLEHAFIRPVTPVGGFMWDEMYRIQKLAVNLQGEPKALLGEMKKNLDAELAKVKALEGSKIERNHKTKILH
ncbi:ABC transporter substrate-binding protein [Paenibacillus sepulcri]|uniref:ABC transporter substrate-binding protein n=2 Tax=Paenibacillus sepulcri TaxID=359917 RepID=A0ABS7BVY2_9BACL|nr:ABC transporter substrate-binding protein [Paenibacillus sepulcri]